MEKAPPISTGIVWLCVATAPKHALYNMQSGTVVVNAQTRELFTKDQLSKECLCNKPETKNVR